ncbi:MAG: family 16 glycoside hydrolase [Planctomycetaceae bacterium]
MTEFSGRHHWLPALFGGLAILISYGAADAADADGFMPIFDGKSLDGWDGNPELWSVEDGAITGRTTDENPIKANSFLVWRDGEVGDFELKLEYKIVGGNSGIQYRSKEMTDAKWVIGGYQADFEAGDTYSGINYDERGRGILAQRGQKTRINDDGKPEVLETFADTKELQAKINKEDWNEYHVIADGFTFTHKINGHVTSIVVDDDESDREATGLLALQVHTGPPMTVQFRNIRLKRLDGGKKTGDAGPKKIVFVAGGPSHAYGEHEHKAGCLLLESELKASGLPAQTTVVTNGWPKDESVFDDTTAIVIYADGGGGHPAMKHLDKLRELADAGVGIVCLHYGVEVPKGEGGDAFLDTIGGYFEPHWSVNPHWTANYKNLPVHPITRGIGPFHINDEWYYHMRFREDLEGITPILTDLPPAETLARPDGPHSGNSAVRQAIAQGKPQHVAWAYERPNGGRGFGFTGGHFHWNWGHPEFRQLVLNAIVWSADIDVPKDGVPVRKLTVSDLEANQDEQPPADHNPARIQAMLDDWNR